MDALTLMVYLHWTKAIAKATLRLIVSQEI